MTGEITLRGKVLPVGGIKDKVLAAYRAGIRTIILSTENDKDLDDLPEEIRSEMEFHLVSTMDEVIKIALEGQRPAPAAAAVEPGRQARRGRHRRELTSRRRPPASRNNEVVWSRQSPGSRLRHPDPEHRELPGGFRRRITQ